MNHKKLRRLYAEERLQVRRRGGRKRALGTRAPMTLPQGPNQRWSLDFAFDALTDGRRFRILVVVDDFSRECLGLVADTSLSGKRVARELDAIIAARAARPLLCVSDNGTELTSNAILTWCVPFSNPHSPRRARSDPILNQSPSYLRSRQMRRPGSGSHATSVHGWIANDGSPRASTRRSNFCLEPRPAPVSTSSSYRCYLINARALHIWRFTNARCWPTRWASGRPFRRSPPPKFYRAKRA